MSMAEEAEARAGTAGGLEPASAMPTSVGERVRLHSLLGDRAAELNGEMGVVDDYDGARRRYTVQMDTGVTVHVRSGNLSVVPPLGESS